MDVSNLTGKHLKIVKDSAVSDHLLQCNCTIDFDNFDIFATDVSECGFFKCDLSSDFSRLLSNLLFQS